MKNSWDRGCAQDLAGVPVVDTTDEHTIENLYFFQS